MIVYVLKALIIFAISFAVYKLISMELEKARKDSEQILNECKTDEEKTNAITKLKRKNIQRAFGFYFFVIVILALLVFAFAVIRLQQNKSTFTPLGSYILFENNGQKYYGKHDYSIFCAADYPDGKHATYKIFSKKDKTVFETKSCDQFILELEKLFNDQQIDKINLYSVCGTNSSYYALGFALNNSNLIQKHEIERIEKNQIIHVITKNGVNIEIEFLVEDMLCICGSF